MFPVGGNLHSGVPQFTTNFGGANTMAQKVVGLIKLQIPAGKATPAPPVGPCSWSARRKYRCVHKGF